MVVYTKLNGSIQCNLLANLDLHASLLVICNYTILMEPVLYCNL